MPSTQMAPAKRVAPPRQSAYSKTFVKDWIRCDRSGRFDMPRLKKVMVLLIANEGPLAPEYKDHALKGDWKYFRDCHVHGDFLLLYRVTGRDVQETIIFERLGTHSELF